MSSRQRLKRRKHLTVPIDRYYGCDLAFTRRNHACDGGVLGAESQAGGGVNADTPDAHCRPESIGRSQPLRLPRTVRACEGSKRTLPSQQELRRQSRFRAPSCKNEEDANASFVLRIFGVAKLKGQPR
jgi:hypothetical protein